MNRIEIVGLFSAMKSLVKLKAYDELENMIDAVLDEAQTKKNKNGKNKSKEETK
ncbi:MAG: hypothetical protein FWF77_00905 [Defluviitaleaceae bacterium]|nr:hypothetical protein [Defluviitaleaceae bacterium]